MFLFELLLYAALVLWLALLWKRRRYYALIWQIPGPVGLPLIGMAHKLRRASEILPAFEQVLRKYGMVFYSWLGPFPFLVITDPQMAEDVLTSPHCVNKALIYGAIDDGIGRGLFSMRNPAWSRHRKLLNPAFSNRVLQSFVPIFNEETSRLLGTLEQLVGTPEVDLLSVMQRFTLNVAIKTTMGKSLCLEQSAASADLLQSYECILRMMSDMCFSPWLSLKLFRILWGRESAYRRAKDNIRDFITQLVDEQLRADDAAASAGSRENNIFIKIAVDLYRGGNFTRQNVIDEANVIVSGASETTANTATYTLILLAMHPKFQEKAYEELCSIFPDAGDFEVTYADTQQMVYMDMILNEVMRLISPVPLVARQTAQDVKLYNGVVLPAGIQVAIDIFHMHRSTEIWGPEATSFNPERFLRANMEGRHAYAFMPFTKGIRNCIGWRYALMSVKITLAKLLRNYRFTTGFSYADLCFVEDITIKLKQMPLFELEPRRDHNN